MPRTLPILPALALASTLGVACVGSAPTADTAPTPAPDAGTPEAAPPPPWTPADLPGLALWLRASDGLHLDAKQNVTAWDDQSGHDNTAVPAPGAAPRLTMYLGQPAVQFSAMQALQMNDASPLRWHDDFGVLVVAASMQSAMTYGMLYGKSAVAYPYAGPSLMTDYPNGPKGYTGAIGGQLDIQDAVVSGPAALDDYKLRLYALTRSGDTIAVRVDDDPATTLAVANPPQDTTAAGTVAYVGGHPQNGGVIQGFEGVILEVIGVDGTLDDPDYAQAWAYASQRYGL